MKYVTAEVVYKCDTQADYDALVAHFGIATPLGYTRVDDENNLCMVLTATQQLEIPE